MSSTEFTTEVFDSDITVVLIDTVGCFSAYFQPFFEEKNIRLLHRSIDDQLNLIDICDVAYKIVVCISPTFFTLPMKELLEKLSIYQTKLTIVMPLVGSFEQQVLGEIPYVSEILTAQQDSILYCNNLLPFASFVFGLDIILPPGNNTLFDVLMQNIQQGSILAPTITGAPQTLPRFTQAATEEILRPQPGSVTISGRTKPLALFLQRAAQVYEAYYFTYIQLQTVSAQEVPTVPFTTKSVVVSELLDEIISWYTHSLPSPQQERFFKPILEHFFSNSLEEAEPIFELDLSRFAPIDTPKEVPNTEFIDFVDEPTLQKPPEEIILTPAMEESFHGADIALSEPEIVVKKTSPDFTEQFNVSSEIQKIFSQSRTEDKIERATILAKREKKVQKKSKKRTILFYGGMAFTGIGLGILLLMIVFFSSVFFLKKSLVTVMQQATTQKEITDKDWTQLAWFDKILSAQTKAYTSVVELPQLDESQHLVDAGKKLQEIKLSLESGNESQKKLITSILGSSTGDVALLAQNTASQSLITYENINQLQTDIAQISFGETSIDTITKSYEDRLSELKRQVSLQQQFQPILAGLFGQNERRTYAVVLQNNQELRPTGGFVEAVALVTFEKGTLISKTVYTSYDLDSKLPGDVAPPAEVSRFLGEKKFFFHDSNWDPDFPKTADQMKWFVEKSLNTTVDGVVTIDLYGMQNVLDVIGPLDIPEFNEVVTQKNLFERMEFHSEVILVDTNKNQDYRKLVFTRFLDKLVSLPEDKGLDFVKALQKSFTDQSLLAYFPRAQEQQVLQNIGWTGSLASPNCPTQFADKVCQIDSFMQVEANVGVNKANYYLNRTVEHTIELSPTLAKHTRTVTFENTAQSGAWPKGPYKNYMRFYIPSSAQNITLSIDGSPLPEPQVIKTVNKNWLIIGFLLEVPIKSTQTVKLQFSTPLTVAADKAPFSYIFYNHEQPGNGAYPLLVRMVPSSDIHPKIIAPQATLGSDGVTFLKNADKTGLYGIQFDQAN